MRMKRRHELRHRQSGFTLVEILLVVIIIAILASVALPRITGRKKESEIAATKAEIANLGTALSLYEMDMGEFPKSLQDLFASPGGSDKWKGPYLEKGMPKDKWDHDYIYICPGTHNPTSYDLHSLGPDGVESADDLANWQTDQLK